MKESRDATKKELKVIAEKSRSASDNCDATQKELKGRPLPHRVSARVSERFSWVRLGRLSIGFCD